MTQTERERHRERERERERERDLHTCVCKFKPALVQGLILLGIVCGCDGQHIHLSPKLAPLSSYFCVFFPFFFSRASTSTTTTKLFVCVLLTKHTDNRNIKAAKRPKIPTTKKGLMT
jgi:hypothetical protein